MRAAAAFLAGVLCWLAAAAPAAPGTIATALAAGPDFSIPPTLVSVGPAGGNGAMNLAWLATSADASHVAFWTRERLTPDDTNTRPGHLRLVRRRRAPPGDGRRRRGTEPAGGPVHAGRLPPGIPDRSGARPRGLGQCRRRLRLVRWPGPARVDRSHGSGQRIRLPARDRARRPHGLFRLVRPPDSPGPGQQRRPLQVDGRRRLAAVDHGFPAREQRELRRDERDVGRRVARLLPDVGRSRSHRHRRPGRPLPVVGRRRQPRVDRTDRCGHERGRIRRIDGRRIACVLHERRPAHGGRHGPPGRHLRALQRDDAARLDRRRRRGRRHIDPLRRGHARRIPDRSPRRWAAHERRHRRRPGPVPVRPRGGHAADHGTARSVPLRQPTAPPDDRGCVPHPVLHERQPGPARHGRLRGHLPLRRWHDGADLDGSHPPELRHRRPVPGRVRRSASRGLRHRRADRPRGHQLRLRRRLLGRRGPHPHADPAAGRPVQRVAHRPAWDVARRRNDVHGPEREAGARRHGPDDRPLPVPHPARDRAGARVRRGGRHLTHPRGPALPDQGRRDLRDVEPARAGRRPHDPGARLGPGRGPEHAPPGEHVQRGRPGRHRALSGGGLGPRRPAARRHRGSRHGGRPRPVGLPQPPGPSRHPRHRSQRGLPAGRDPAARHVRRRQPLPAERRG